MEKFINAYGTISFSPYFIKHNKKIIDNWINYIVKRSQADMITGIDGISNKPLKPEYGNIPFTAFSQDDLIADLNQEFIPGKQTTDPEAHALATALNKEPQGTVILRYYAYEEGSEVISLNTLFPNLNYTGYIYDEYTVPATSHNLIKLEIKDGRSLSVIWPQIATAITKKYPNVTDLELNEVYQDLANNPEHDGYLTEEELDYQDITPFLLEQTENGTDLVDFT